MSNKKDSLGDRMKSYENISRTHLTRRVPVIIRIDGKAFHTFTRGMRKPFDPVLMSAMQQTMKYLCENIQGCVLGYTQSDEITLVLTDYATITTDAWFGYGVQKMCSIVASMATMAFNRYFHGEVMTFTFNNGENYELDSQEYNLCEVYRKAVKRGAMFDARVFTVPKEEVCNCLIWRQQDATRNSIESVGQAYFSHNQLHKKTCNMIQDMLHEEKGINWNNFPTDCKRGACCYRVERTVEMADPRNAGQIIPVTRRQWEIDREIPIFTQNRDYVEKWL